MIEGNNQQEHASVPAHDIGPLHMGNYRLVRALRRGGFATVYLGEHMHLNTPAAIKVIHRQEPHDVTRFLTEARLHANMHHQHIVRVLDFGIEADRAFMVTDYATNGTLAEYFPQGVNFPIQAILPFILQIADALGYLHRRNMVHRDIKPHNVLLGPDNLVWLSDFGFTTAAQPWNRQQVRDSVGTAAFAAPEQIQGMPLTASDQYSLAVMVYSWLSGQLPFEGNSRELCDQHLHTPPPRLRNKIPSISFTLDAVVMKALSKDPYRRFPSIQDFAHALQAASWKLEHTTEPIPAVRTHLRTETHTPMFDPPKKRV